MREGNDEKIVDYILKKLTGKIEKLKGKVKVREWDN